MICRLDHQLSHLLLMQVINVLMQVKKLHVDGAVQVRCAQCVCGRGCKSRIRVCLIWFCH